MREGFRESRRCSRDTYPESYITEYEDKLGFVVDNGRGRGGGAQREMSLESGSGGEGSRRAMTGCSELRAHGLHVHMVGSMPRGHVAGDVHAGCGPPRKKLCPPLPAPEEHGLSANL